MFIKIDGNLYNRGHIIKVIKFSNEFRSPGYYTADVYLKGDAPIVVRFDSKKERDMYMTKLEVALEVKSI